MPLEFIGHRIACCFVNAAVCIILGSDVRRHNDEGIFEIHDPALRIGDMAVVKDLEQDIEYIRMGFFNFVEQHHGIRPAPYCFGKLSAFIVADISRRRAHEPRYREFFHVLGHVDAHHGPLVVEKRVGERAENSGYSYDSAVAWCFSLKWVYT
jgi:hypothetical protein